MTRRAQDDRGVSIIIVALALVAICAIAALAIDIGNARQIRRQEQGGVDAAALAAAQELPKTSDAAATQTGKQTATRSRAMEYAARDLVGPSATTSGCAVQTAPTWTCTMGKVTVSVTTPWNPNTSTSPTAGDADYNSSLGFVYVKACQKTTTFFGQVIRQSSPTVCTSAVGRFNSGPPKADFGLVATDPHACTALSFAGNSDTILTSNGAVMVNSDCASGQQQALDSSGTSWQLKFIDGTGNYVPGYVGVVGGATLAPCDPATQTTKCTQTTPTTGIAAFGDPLSGMTPPPNPGGTPKACDKDGGHITPGLYSSCMVTSNNANLDMEPGVYYVTGEFKFTGGNIRCVDGGGRTCGGPTSPSPWTNASGTNPAGVMIYVLGQFTLTGNGTVDLAPYAMPCPAPKSQYKGDCWDGMAVWNTSTARATINGTNNFNLGTVYVPNAQLQANGSGGGAKVNISGLVVAKTVDISGTFDFNIKVPNSSPDIPGDPDIGLER